VKIRQCDSCRQCDNMEFWRRCRHRHRHRRWRWRRRCRWRRRRQCSPFLERFSSVSRSSSEYKLGISFKKKITKNNQDSHMLHVAAPARIITTGAMGHRLSAFLFLKFYRDFQIKILWRISYTNFQNPLYRDFPVKKFPIVFGSPGLGWPPGGGQRLQRVCARRCAVPGNSPNSSSPPTAKIRFFRQ
jgi:hypothetical protein